MSGRERLAKLAAQKQALLVESSLNRLALQTGLGQVRSATAWVGEAVRLPNRLAPLLFIVAPLAGFLLTRISHRSDSWLNRAIAIVKWIGPLYRWWKRFSAPRPEDTAG